MTFVTTEETFSPHWVPRRSFSAYRYFSLEADIPADAAEVITGPESCGLHSTKATVTKGNAYLNSKYTLLSIHFHYGYEII